MENGGFSLARMYLEAGYMSYVATACAAVIAILLFALPKLPEPVAWVLALVPFALGYVGYTLGVRTVDDAVAHVEPALKAELLAAGVREARQNLVIGGVLTAITAVIALVTKARRAS